MAKENSVNAEGLEVNSPKIVKKEKFTLRKDYVIGGKPYKKDDSFSHDNEKVIEFLLTNKIILKDVRTDI